MIGEFELVFENGKYKRVPPTKNRFQRIVPCEDIVDRSSFVTNEELNKQTSINRYIAAMDKLAADFDESPDFDNIPLSRHKGVDIAELSTAINTANEKFNEEIRSKSKQVLDNAKFNEFVKNSQKTSSE